MQYTIENLRTQLINLQERISEDQSRLKAAFKIDYAPAVNYGEEIRINHLRTINMRLGAMRKKALELRFKIEDMENES